MIQLLLFTMIALFIVPVVVGYLLHRVSDDREPIPDDNGNPPAAR